jgi:type VI secretion system protein ImpG
MNNAGQIMYETVDSQGKSWAVSIGPENIKPVGFEPNENMLPYPRRSFPGYNLLFEYFCFPEKFLFFDICGLSRINERAATDTLQIWIHLKRSAKPNLVINEDTFVLNASPAVNLFKRIAEPIRVEHRKTEYRVVPDVRRQHSTEVFSVDQVKATSMASAGEEIEYKPFYSIRHHLVKEDAHQNHAFWHLQRQMSQSSESGGSEVFLAFTGADFSPLDPGVEILTVYTTCTNRDLPARLPFGDPAGDFELEVEAPVARISCLIKPTPTRRPFLGGELQWRLISHLSLNYMSLVQGGETALKEILNLYDFENSPSTRQQIEGIVSLNSRRVTKRIGQCFSRGVEVTVVFDEDKFVGAGLYLFASILERFLAQYVSINSFSQMVAKTIQQKEILKKWMPRSGNQTLL